MGPGTLLTIMSKQRLDVARVACGIVRGEPGFARGEDIGKIELFLAGPQLDERVEDLVQALRWAVRRAGRSC